MDLFAEITGVAYTPHLCSDLKLFAFADLDQAISNSTFILDIDDINRVAVSRWVSPKRTRSYPYARVYDTMGFSGKKITIIPIIKDEGKRGDRDFLQWDTISLMSLLNVHVIIAYYVDAERSARYPDEKITKQRFDVTYVKGKIEEILSYQSSPLHWNLAQADAAGNVAKRALDIYSVISDRLNIEMHSRQSAERRILMFQEGRNSFLSLSRQAAQAAQQRETVTLQPKESISGTKGSITIQNYQGGHYYLTLDEVEIDGEDIHLIEAKHSSKAMLPSPNDIKDGLIKMLLFTNLKELTYEGQMYSPKPTLKLTGGRPFNYDALHQAQRRFWDVLAVEASTNGLAIRTG